MSAAPASQLGIVAGTALGQALAARLAADERPVRSCAPGSKDDLCALAAACELIVVDAEPGDLPALAAQLGDVTDGNHRLVHTVRGLVGEGVTAIELLRRETPVRRLGVLAGPLNAADLSTGRPTAAVVASRHPEVVDGFTAALSTPRLRVYRGRDPLGVEVAQSLVDLVAFACGLTAGLGFGEATRSLLIVRSVRELGRVITSLGGEEKTAGGLAGLGAVLVRASDTEGGPYRLGRAAASPEGRGGADFQAGTAALLQTARTLKEHARRQKVAAHLLDGLADLLAGSRTPQDLLGALMAIPVLDD